MAASFVGVCTANAEPRVLLIGDSWAAGMLLNRSFDKAFANFGLDDVELSGQKTALGGSTAREWAKNHDGKLDAIASELSAKPSLDTALLFLGGNDLLGWAQKNALESSTPEQRESLYRQICGDLETVIRFLSECRPGIRVVLCDYDFLDPARITEVYDLEFKGDCTPKLLNDALLELAKKKAALIAEFSNGLFVSQYGLLQRQAGMQAASDLPSPPELMPDGVHPSPAGFDRVAAGCLQSMMDADPPLFANPGKGPDK
ncbi:MAG: hypothetical protein AMXMBFR84_31180 [Candidatus Hydrogenedentota bacterium]